MSLAEYTDKVEALHSFFNRELPLQLKEQLSVQYAFTSASFSNFMRHIQIYEHPGLYNQILLHQKLSILDESFPRAMEDAKYECDANTDITIFQKQPAVFCTMHIGSYRLINFLLKRHRIPFVLIANKNIVNTEKERFEKNYNSFHIDDGFPLSMIDAENPSAVISMFRALRQGKSLLIYIDGNIGSGNNTATNENLCCINFLDQQIYVRSGVAYLSMKAKVPIVPVICFKPTVKTNTFRIYEPIYPFSQPGDIRIWLQETMQQVYAQMETVIRQYPGQWEGWLYVHKSAKTVCSSVMHRKLSHVPEQVMFNSDGFAIFKIGNDCFLLKRSNYSSFPIDECLYNFLLYCLPSHINNITLDRTLLNELMSEHIVL